ncbi:MAG TPA: folylpolyglutamate synthase/dihydrofolate synthase family protein, partial [Lacipirellulaceae bacterium]|nr:folylpolyglutamate synthase/dihydrofolate synthase family protein [Lacipirellulaceae bacterium]
LASARDRALDWLMGRINYERTATVPYNQRQLKLDRMRQLLVRLGQPDAGMKIVHVAGTKGKGSTSAMVAAMLTAAGYRTGVFSSPHLERIEERFVVDGEPCASDELVVLVDRLRPVVEAMDEDAARDGDSTAGPTYFEITTAMALLHFVERRVDVAVLEVGLGGRLDSTNVCLPMVSVITSISFDHMKQLGNTLAAIAREKAGIIKPGVPVVCGASEPEAKAVIAEVAREHGCRLIQLGEDFTFQYQRSESPVNNARQGDKACGELSRAETRRQEDNSRVSPSPSLPLSPSNPPTGTVSFSHHVPGQEKRLTDIPLAMPGAHQAANAAVALATIEELRYQGWCISAGAMRMGLSRAALPGRIEIFTGDPTVILDAAHNPASARALVAALAELPTPSRRTLVLSVSHDKDVRAILRELAPHFDHFIITQYQDNPRAVSAETLAAMMDELLASRGLKAIVCPTPALAWEHVTQNATPGERICITGSFYLAAEMRPLVKKRAHEVPVPFK